MSTIAKIIEPITFSNYVIEQTKKQSKLIQSNIITQDERLNSLVRQGGRTVNMPLWGRLEGESEVLSDERELTVDEIGTNKDVAVQHFRGKAWGANDLASALAGDSAMVAIGNQVTEYWVADEQDVLVSSLKGVFSSAGMAATHVNSTGAISPKAILDTKQLLGDAASQLVTMFVHSYTFTELQKQNLIKYIPLARSEVLIPTYLGYVLLVDDGMPTDGTYFDSYIMARGCVGRGDGLPVDAVPVETDRKKLAGKDILINRRYFLLHPYGIKWAGDAAGLSPTNAELATGTNWQKVYADKNIGMVCLRHTLDITGAGTGLSSAMAGEIVKLFQGISLAAAGTPQAPQALQTFAGVAGSATSTAPETGTGTANPDEPSSLPTQSGLRGMNTADLTQLAEALGVDLTGATNNDQRREAIWDMIEEIQNIQAGDGEAHAGINSNE